MLIFLLPVLLATSAAALFTVTAGSNFVIASIAVLEYQRRQGYKGGEGRLSEREAGAYYSTKLDQNSDHDLSINLGRLALHLPTLFAPYIDKKFDFTKTEGELLRSIIHPAVQALNELEGVKIMLEQDPGNEDFQSMLFAMVDNLGMLVAPIIIFLEQFPSKRVKKA